MGKKVKEYNKRSLIGFAVGFAVMAIAVSLSTRMFNNTNAQQLLINTAKEYNNTLPIYVDDMTRLDTVIIPSKNTIEYRFTCIDVIKEEANYDTIAKYINPSILNNIKDAPELKKMRDNNIVWKYYYSDMNGDFFYEYIVTPDMYK